MVTPSLLLRLPLSPRKLRYLAALFILSAGAALLTGCSAAGSGDDTASAANGLRGLALAMRPSGHIASDPAQPQRHARQPQLLMMRAPQRHQFGGSL